MRIFEPPCRFRPGTQFVAGKTWVVTECIGLTVYMMSLGSGRQFHYTIGELRCLLRARARNGALRIQRPPIQKTHARKVSSSAA